MTVAKISGTGKQHVQMYRKLLMRRNLLRWAIDGAAYVPFIGDGDIAAEMYADRRIYGADLDADRVATASARLDGEIIVADCDGWPFPDLAEPVAVADFDAYVNPYASFRAFWSEAPRAGRLVLFFTDGQRQGIKRTGTFPYPDGSFARDLDLSARRDGYHFYLSRHIWPWFENLVAPWRVLDRFRYLRQDMAYWGAAIERPPTEEAA